ncbi:hypothetical protein TWF696_004135 [Orbilia brochopaga]|uniref:Nucleoside phosphorylase domain-containing protein n=1 Tax=Orbilia brochopaga TaxID=3140254 RepID=A0AAV9V5H0_9PEZI
MASLKRLSHADYTIGWICALPLEMAASQAMLDDIHARLPTKPGDENTYCLGEVSGHNIVIACLPSGSYGSITAATVAAHMLSTFRAIRFGLMVGIGGGVPSPEADIRLGDVVVSKPQGGNSGVIFYDFGKILSGEQFERTGTLNKPPQALLTAIAYLESTHMMGSCQMPNILSNMVARYPRMSQFTYPGHEHDELFEAEYDHIGLEQSCDACDKSRLVDREPRLSDDPQVHYGLIASGNMVMRDGHTRDRVAKQPGILCFEMEASGLMDHFPCLVIRGICDYSDSHKNKQWQGYAAATAAAYAKELLSTISARTILKTPAVSEARNTVDNRSNHSNDRDGLSNAEDLERPGSPQMWYCEIPSCSYRSKYEYNWRTHMAKEHDVYSHASSRHDLRSPPTNTPQPQGDSSINDARGALRPKGVKARSTRFRSPDLKRRYTEQQYSNTSVRMGGTTYSGNIIGNTGTIMGNSYTGRG